MAMTLEADLETRIERELARGVYRAPSELLSHALDLVEFESAVKARRVEILAELQVSLAEAERGECVTEEQLRARMRESRRLRASAA